MMRMRQNILSEFPRLAIKDDVAQRVRNVAQSVSLTKHQATFCVRLTRNCIAIHEFQGHFELSYSEIPFEEVVKLPEVLAKKPDSAVFIMLSGWDTEIRTVNFAKTHLWDLLSALKTFRASEFNPADYVISASNVSQSRRDTYTFFGIKNESALSCFFEVLQQIPNPIATVSSEELWVMTTAIEQAKRVSITQRLTDWVIVLTLQGDHWKLIVGHHEAPKLIRSGTVYDINKKEEYLLREILDTVRYLDRLGHQAHQPVTLICNPDDANLSKLKTYGVLLCYIKGTTLDMIRFINHESHGQVLKNILPYKRPLHLHSFRIPSLSWHGLAFHLPRYLMNILIPAIGLIIMSTGVYYIKGQYYGYLVKTQTVLLQNSQSHIKTDAILNKRIQLFDLFSKNLQTNPSVVFKNIARTILPDAIAQTIKWSSQQNRFSTQIDLRINPKNNSKTIDEKEALLSFKERVDSKILKKYPDFSVQWQGQDTQKLSLTIVGPTLMKVHASLAGKAEKK